MSKKPSDIAESVGLAGSTISPIPNETNIAATVHKDAEERYNQLLQGTSTQETLIYHGATTSHLKALNGDYPGRITFFGDEGSGGTDGGLLFFRMRLPVHEVAAQLLHNEIKFLGAMMGLRRNLISVGASEFKCAHNSGPCKESDQGFKPRPPRWAKNHFPSLVIETGNSESLLVLRKDKDWWFDNSPPGGGGPNGDVKVVFLIRLETRTKRIRVEQWHRDRSSPSYSVDVSTPQPDEPFSLHDDRCWAVEGDVPMTIRFEEVMLRPPNEQNKEQDFVLTREFFVDLAMTCWQQTTVNDLSQP